MPVHRDRGSGTLHACASLGGLPACATAGTVGTSLSSLRRKYPWVPAASKNSPHLRFRKIPRNTILIHWSLTGARAKRTNGWQEEARRKRCSTVQCTQGGRPPWCTVRILFKSCFVSHKTTQVLFPRTRRHYCVHVESRLDGFASYYNTRLRVDREQLTQVSLSEAPFSNPSFYFSNPSF